MAQDPRGKIVWSSGPDGPSSPPENRACRHCGSDPCSCEPVVSRPPSEHDLRVRSERSGRRGKTVTLAGPFYLVRSDAAELLKRMKKNFGGGGTLVAKPAPSGAPSFTLEIQGDHAEKLIEFFEKLGYAAKRSGG